MGEKITAIIVAAGSGQRMCSDVKKQYMDINGKPLVCYSINAFMRSSVDEIVLVVPESDIEMVKTDIVEKYGFTKVKSVVSGGTTRTKSVQKGLMAALDSYIVLVHDAARPMIEPELIDRVVDAVKEEDAAFLAVPVKNTIYYIDGDKASNSLDRNMLYAAQTPQGFKTELLKRAYDEAEKEIVESAKTDDVTFVYNHTGVMAEVIMGDHKNTKVTTPEDAVLAKLLLQDK